MEDDRIDHNITIRLSTFEGKEPKRKPGLSGLKNQELFLELGVCVHCTCGRVLLIAGVPPFRFLSFGLESLIRTCVLLLEVSPEP